MSVVITTYCNQFIAMCADRQRTSTFTGEEQVDAVTKVESLSPSIAIGRCGNLWLSDLVLSIVKGTIEETGIDNVTTEEVADLFCQAYQFAREEDPEITDAMGIRFVVAGKLSNGELGVIVVSLGNGGKGMEMLENRQIPGSHICEPPDVSEDECHQLLSKAISNTKNKKSCTMMPSKQHIVRLLDIFQNVASL